MTTSASTEQLWNDLWERLGAGDKVWIKRQYQLMRRHYAEPHRAYHVWGHIEYGLRLIYQYRHLIENFDAVLLGWLLHDVIYR